MNQMASGQRAGFPKIMKTVVGVIVNLVVLLFLLAFLHNVFAVDIRINHATHQIGVQLIFNDLPHVSAVKVLQYAGHFLCPQSSSCI